MFAGTFWYHAHTNETVQMERGMCGALIVDGEAEPVVDGEKIFMIDDINQCLEKCSRTKA
jgi:FtsP/CotA-like multicopper oxidase with cupredoxin domain